MKKKFKIITIIAIILILGIVILFFSKVNKISLIESIKQKIAKAEEIQTVNEVTTVDITDLEDNGNLEHDHIFKTVYDKENHWEECTICGQKVNEKNHSYTSSWTMGNANNCSESNINKFSCECGYTYSNAIGRKNHNYLQTVNLPSVCSYYQECTTCYSKLNFHDCYLNNETRISCKNPGLCKICKFNYSNTYVMHYASTNTSEDLTNIKCVFCDKNFPVKFEKFENYEIEEGKIVIDLDAEYKPRYKIY